MWAWGVNLDFCDARKPFPLLSTKLVIGKAFQWFHCSGCRSHNQTGKCCFQNSQLNRCASYIHMLVQNLLFGATFSDIKGILPVGDTEICASTTWLSPKGSHVAHPPGDGVAHEAEGPEVCQATSRVPSRESRAERIGLKTHSRALFSQQSNGSDLLDVACSSHPRPRVGCERLFSLLFGGVPEIGYKAKGCLFLHGHWGVWMVMISVPLPGSFGR